LQYLGECSQQMAVLLEVARDEVTITACLAHNSHGVMREIRIPLDVDPLSANGLVIFENQ